METMTSPEVDLVDLDCYPLIVRTEHPKTDKRAMFINHAGMSTLKWRSVGGNSFDCQHLCSSFIQFKDADVPMLEIIHTVPKILSNNSGELSEPEAIRMHIIWQSMLPEDFQHLGFLMDSGEYGYKMNNSVWIRMHIRDAGGIDYAPYFGRS